MNEDQDVNSNRIIRELTKKSLFTERQIEILSNYKGISKTEFQITRGAYYRQLAQVRSKLASFYYTQARVIELIVKQACNS